MTCLFIFIMTYSVYYFSIFSSVPGGDSGELLAEACQLGVAHPPGYPIYTILSHFVSKYMFFLRLTPDGKFVETTVAWRVNHLCSIFGALTAAIIGATIIEMGNRKSKSVLSASVGAFVFAFAPLVWEYSVGAEVFALNNLFSASLIYLTVRVHNLASVDGSTLSLISLTSLGALVVGLSLTHQHSSLLLIVILVPYVLYTIRTRLNVSSLLVIIVSFLTGMTPYLYLFLTPAKPGSWGDTASLRGLRRHTLREEYGTFQLSGTRGSEGTLLRIYLYLGHLQQESFYCLLPLALAGAVLAVAMQLPTGWFAKSSSGSAETVTKAAPAKKGRTAKVASGQARTAAEATADTKRPKAGILPSTCLALAWLFYVCVWHGILSNIPLSAPMPFAVHSRFWMQPNLILSVLAGFGVGQATEFLLSTNAVKKHLSLIESGRLVLELGACLAVVAVVVSSRFRAMDRSFYGWTMHQYGESILRSLPPASSEAGSGPAVLLLAHTDLNWNPVRYLLTCEDEHRRKWANVQHLNFQMLPYPWFEKRQAPLYPNVTFPSLPPHVSTDRTSNANGELVANLVSANLRSSRFKGGVFVDMQAVNDAEIGDAGRWRNNLVLIPWGPLYKCVFASKTTSGAGSLGEAHHNGSYQQLLRLQETFRLPSEPEFFNMFPKRSGSWEFAAASVRQDSHYQLGLSFLTYAIAGLKSANPSLALILDRLMLADRLLQGVVKTVCTGDVDGSGEAIGSGALSTPIVDLVKNYALCLIRLHNVLVVALKFPNFVAQSDAEPMKPILPNDSLIGAVANSVWIDGVRLRAARTVATFLKMAPKDPDGEAFRSSIKMMNPRKQ